MKSERAAELRGLSATALRVAPAELLRGDHALRALALRLRAESSPESSRVLLVHGSHGYPLVRERLGAALGAAALDVSPCHHEGPCHDVAINAIASQARRVAAAWILGVGGGRVIDTAKGAAHVAGLRYAALPTSPATCAATAPTVVIYDASGRHLDVREDGRSVELCALDTDLLASAPDRLLVAGVVDAWAKVHEVRLTGKLAGRGAATSRAALALVDDLDALLAEHAQAALEAGPAGRRDAALLPSRKLVAEAIVTYPGLIGGLAGPDVKVALAHTLHDALTTLPGSHASLHGEKVAFGALVQIRLTGRDGEARDEDRAAAMRAEAATYTRLGLACDLEALGCTSAREEALEEQVVRYALADPCVLQALPGLERQQLTAALREVDDWLSRGRERPSSG